MRVWYGEPDPILVLMIKTRNGDRVEKKPPIIVAVLAVLYENDGVVRYNKKDKRETAVIVLAKKVEERFGPGIAKNQKTVCQRIYRANTEGILIPVLDGPRTTKEIRFGEWSEYKPMVMAYVNESPSQGTAVVAVRPETGLSPQELNLIHENHELKAIIAQMEPYLRQIDVYEFIIKGRI